MSRSPRPSKGRGSPRPRAPRGARGGGGRGWRGDGHPALPQAVERAADLLAHGALAGARLERQQEGRHLGARKLAERGRQRRAVGPGEQRRDRLGPDPAGAHRLGVEAEAHERRGRLLAARAHEPPLATARGYSPRRASTWSRIQCASHHSTGSTCTPWIMMLKWRWSPAARPVSPVLPIGSPRPTGAPG